jgi:hypothetical protein
MIVTRGYGEGAPLIITRGYGLGILPTVIREIARLLSRITREVILKSYVD